MVERNENKFHTEKVLLKTDQGIRENEEQKWRMPLDDVYKHGLHFYKDKEGKAIHLSYEDRLRLVAYTQQAAHGPLQLKSAPPLGVLDVIGRDRRAAWQALGQMSQTEAMAEFIHTLDRLCPMFKPYIEAIQKNYEDRKIAEMKRVEEERANLELQKRIIMESEKKNSPRITEEQRVQRIKDALNAQTYDQFLEYAQQQYPGNFDQQAVLIRQLQEQHYQQYLQQLLVDKRLADSSAAGSQEEGHNTTDQSVCQDEIETKHSGVCENVSSILKKEDTRDQEEYIPEVDDLFPMEEAHMWTRGDVDKFKESAKDAGGLLTVGHGESVTVRVPTLKLATKICWEFATDNYDIGFGIYFEWSKPVTEDMTVHFEDSGDEDDEDEDYIEEDISLEKDDPEVGSERSRRRKERPPLSLVVPVYRRDSHLQVYAGSHSYPGEGVYLLKFDNMYSLWRSKSLYYKVYYTK